MSLHPQAPYPIPEDTQRVARAAFPRGNIYMQVADHLGTLYHDAQFTGPLPHARPTGRSASAPGTGHASSSLPKAYPIAKPRMLSAAALIGNTSWASTSPIPASTIPS